MPSYTHCIAVGYTAVTSESVIIQSIDSGNTWNVSKSTIWGNLQDVYMQVVGDHMLGYIVSSNGNVYSSLDYGSFSQDLFFTQQGSIFKALRSVAISVNGAVVVVGDGSIYVNPGYDNNWIVQNLSPVNSK